MVTRETRQEVRRRISGAASWFIITKRNDGHLLNLLEKTSFSSRSPRTD